MVDDKVKELEEIEFERNRNQYQYHKHNDFVAAYTDWKNGGTLYKDMIEDSSFNQDFYTPEQIDDHAFYWGITDNVSVRDFKIKALENLFEHYAYMEEKGRSPKEEAFQLFEQITFDPTNEDDLLYGSNSSNDINFAKSALSDAYGKSDWVGRTEEDIAEDKKRLQNSKSDEYGDFIEDLTTMAQYVADRNNGKVGNYDMPTILRCINNMTLAPKDYENGTFDANNEDHRDQALIYNFITSEYNKAVGSRDFWDRTWDVMKNSRDSTAALFTATFTDDLEELEGISDYRREANIKNRLSFDSISNVGERNGYFVDGLEYIFSTALSQLCNTAFTVAGGMVGGAIGGAAVTGGAGAKVGAFLGGALSGALVNYGEAKLDQYESFGKINYGAAIVQTTGYSILDGLGGATSLGRRTATQLAKDTAKSFVVGMSKKGTVSLGKTLGKASWQVGKDMLTEGITETLQSGLVGRSVHAYLDEDHSFLKEGETVESAIMAQVDEFFAGAFGAGGYGMASSAISIPGQIKAVKEANDAIRSTIESSMTEEQRTEARKKAMELIAKREKKTITEEDFKNLPSAVRLGLMMEVSEVNKLSAGDRVALFVNLMDFEGEKESQVGLEYTKEQLKLARSLLETETDAKKKLEIETAIEELEDKQRQYEDRLKYYSSGEYNLDKNGSYFARAMTKLRNRGAKERHERRKALSPDAKRIYDIYTSKYNGEPLFADNYTENDYIVNGKNLNFDSTPRRNSILRKRSDAAMNAGKQNSLGETGSFSYIDEETGIEFVEDADGITVKGAQNMREPSGENLTFSYSSMVGKTALDKRAAALDLALEAGSKLVAYNNRYNKNLQGKLNMIKDMVSARRPGAKVHFIHSMADLYRRTEDLQKQIEIMGKAEPNNPKLAEMQDELNLNLDILKNHRKDAFMYVASSSKIADIRGDVFIFAEQITSPLQLALKLNHELFHNAYREFLKGEVASSTENWDELNDEQREEILSEKLKETHKLNEKGAIYAETHFTTEPQKIRKFLSNFGALGRKISGLSNKQLMNFAEQVLKTPPYDRKMSVPSTQTAPWSMDDVLEAIYVRNLERTEVNIENIQKTQEQTETETDEENQEVSDANRTESGEKLYKDHKEKIDSLKENDVIVQVSNGEEVAKVTVVSDGGVAIEDIKGNEFIINKDTKDKTGYVEDEEVVDFFDEKKYRIESRQEETTEESTQESQNEPTNEDNVADGENVIEEKKPVQEAKEEPVAKVKEEPKVAPVKEEPTPTLKPTTEKTSATPKSNRFEIATPDNQLKIKGQYRVVDISTLTDMEGTDIQNRIREGNINAKRQEINIGLNLNPTMLMDASTSDRGAPIVDAQGRIISGHGRTHAIQYAYDNDRANEYRDAIVAKAEELGITIPTNVKNPILIRELDSDYTEEQLTDIASRSNQSSLLGQTTAEQAISDAIVLENKDVIGLLNAPKESSTREVNLLNEENYLFMNKFVNEIGNDASLRNQEGKYTDNARNRAKNAILAYLFKEYPNKRNLIINLIENASSLNMTRIVKGILNAAPALVGATRQTNSNKEYDVVNFLGQALDEYITYRRGVEQKIYKSVADYRANNVNLYGAATSDAVLGAFEALAKYSNSQVDTYNFFNNYADYARQELANEDNLLSAFGVDDETLKQKTPAKIIELAMEKTDKQKNERTNGLFAENNNGGINFSTADIQNLDYTFNNAKVSLKPWANVFQKLIKQKDRTIEDVERISKEYIKNVYDRPEEFIPQATGQSLAKLYNSYLIMEDGTEYDPSKLAHANASDLTRTIYKHKQEGTLSDLLTQTASKLNEERAKSVRNLIQYLNTSSTDYTDNERALLVHGAMRYAVHSSKNNVKLVKIDKTNEHPIYIADGNVASRVVGELREGKSYNDAIVDAEKKALAEKSSSRGIPSDFTGWKVFKKSDDIKDAEALNRAVKGTEWCTGGHVSTAQSHLSGGDFHVYFENGEPKIAIRTRNGKLAEPPRGSLHGQAMTEHEETIAEEYLRRTDTGLSGGEDFLADRDDINALMSGTMTWQQAFMMPEQRRSDNGEYDVDIKAWGKSIDAARNKILEDHKEDRLRAGWFFGNEQYNNEDVVVLKIQEILLYGEYINLEIVLGDAIISIASVPKLTSIGGHAKFLKGASVPNLESIGGRAEIYEGANVPKLESIGGYAEFRKGASVPNLKSIGGSASIHEGASIPNIESIGGDIDIYEGMNVSKLESIGGNASLRERVNAPKLESIGGNVYIREGVNVPNLETIGGDAYIHEGVNVLNLKTIEGDARIYEGVNVPILETIGKDAYIHEEANAPKLESIGRYAEIYKGANVPNLETIEGGADLFEGANVPNLKSIGGDAYIYEEVNVPNLETINGYADIYKGANVSNLKTIEGKVYLFEEANVPNLEFIGGFAYIYEGVNAPNLETIEGGVDISGGVNVPNLKSIGGGASIREGASIPNLESIGGYTTIYEGVNVPSLKTIGSEANIDKGVNAPNLKSVNGQPYNNGTVNYSAVGEEGARRLDNKDGTTTRMDNLTLAKNLLIQNRPPEVIKFATGWEQAADGEWRLEDDNAEMKDTAKILDTIEKKKEKKQQIYLSNIIEDNNVVKAYPGIKHLKVVDSSKEKLFRGGAEWSSRTIWLPLDDIESNPEYFKEVLNHEVQHIIQDIEGFATGGNPQQFDLRLSESTRRRKYHRLAGEVEARNVGRRAVNLTDEERRNTLLERTEDVPRNKQLLSNGERVEKGVNYSTVENSEIVEKQKQLNEIIEQIDNLKNSDVANDLLKKAYEGNDIDGYAKWAESSGLNALISNRQALQKEITDAMTKARKEYEEKAKREEEEAIKRSGLSEADYFRKQAIKEFGYTPYFVDGGYILPNGRMLNFSGEKGKHFGTRGQDHRAISIIYADSTGTEAMVRFINEGNIRMMPESPGVEISNVHKPSSEQYKTIRDLARKYADKDYFFVDFADSNGNVVGSLQYDGYVNPMRVVNDIKHFYDTGEIRKPSNVLGFHSDGVNYSSVDDAAYLDAVNRGDMETAQRMVDEAAKRAFPNSVLIQNGEFRKMWHHTNNEFTSFLPGTSASSGGLKGIYFTPQEYSTMARLGNIHKQYYLNVENLRFAFGVAKDRADVERLRALQEGVTDRNEIAEINRKFKEETGIDAFFDWQNGWYNILTPEQIKSADPVTYDDNGNVIPLSQRFNVKNPDINYSSVDDAAYFDAINKGDMETVQRMVDQAARKAGYVVKHMYHATYFLPETIPFREFDPLKGREYKEHRDSVRTPIFFSTDKNAAIDIGTQVVEGNLKTPRRLLQLMYDEKVKPYVYDVYIKEGRDNLLESVLTYWDYENPSHVKMLLKEISSPYNPQYRDIEKQLENGDWSLLESTLVQDALKELEFDGFYTLEQAKNLAVFDNKRIKSSAPITFDVDGNIIPLSQRFDFSKSDINYSRASDIFNMEGASTAKSDFIRYKMMENGEPIPEPERISFEKAMKSAQEKWMPKIADNTYLVDVKKLLDLKNPPTVEQVFDFVVLKQAIDTDFYDQQIKMRENNLSGREKELANQYLDQLQILRHKMNLLDLSWGTQQGQAFGARAVAINAENEIFYLNKKMQELNADTPENRAEVERLQKKLDYATSELQRVQSLLDDMMADRVNIYQQETESREQKARTEHKNAKLRVNSAKSRNVNPLTGEKGQITGTFEENLTRIKAEYDSLFSGGTPTERDMQRFIDNVHTLLIVFYPELDSDFEGAFLPTWYNIVTDFWGKEIFPTIDSFRDFYDRYGVVPKQNVSDIAKKKRMHKNWSLWLSKISDAKKGNVPKRTGRPYYKQSDEERYYATVLNHLLLHNPVEGPGKGAPIESKNPEQEIRTPQQQEIRRLENLIKDVNKEIDKLNAIAAENKQLNLEGKPLKTYQKEQREQVPTNKTIKFLKEKLEQLRELKKKKLEEVNGGDSAVDIIKELEKIQESWQNKLNNAKNNEFPTRSKGKDYDAYTKPSNRVTEIEAETISGLIDTIQTMKDDYKERLYRKNHPLKSQEELLQETIKQATDLLESLEKKLEDAKNGKFDGKKVKTEKPFENNPEVKELRFQIASTRKEIARLKREQARFAEITEEDIKQRHKALTDKIQKMTEKLKDIEINGYTPDNKPSRFALVDKNDPRLADAIAKIKQLNKDINKAKKADVRAEAARLRDRRLASIKARTDAYRRALSHMEATRKPLEKQKKGYIEMYQNDKEFMEAYKALQEVKAEIKRFEQKLDYENGTRGKKALHHIRDLATTSKLLRSSLDASFTWTQCAFLMLRNPILAFRAVKMGFQAALNPEFAELKQFEFTNGEDAYARIRAGLRISEIGDADMSKQEETFSRNLFKSLSGYINKNPVTGTILQASERAFVVPINWLRVLTFDSLCEMHNKKPHELDAETAKTYAKWVNIYTGRGDFYGNPRALGVLNNVFWAPGLVSAHFQQATAPIELAINGFGKEANKRVAKELILKPFRNLMIMYGLRMLIWALTKDEDDEEPPVDLNPISSNFLRIRIGGIGGRWVSVTGGMEKVLSLTSQSIAGKKKNSIGKTIALRGPEADARNRTVVNEILNFFQNKVNPLAGVGMGALDGKERFGDYLNTTEDWMLYIGKNLFLPLPIEDMVEACEEEGIPTGLFFTALSFWGMKGASNDVNLYEKTKHKFEQEVEYSKGLTGEELAKYVQAHPSLKIKKKLSKLAREISKLKSQERKTTDKTERAILKDERESKENEFMLLYKGQ